VIEEKISIELSKDEGLVLFEFLSRFTDGDKLQIVDSSESKVLWNMQTALETMFDEPFLTNYHELLLEAQRRVRVEES
jgi:hypothetical protein